MPTAALTPKEAGGHRGSSSKKSHELRVPLRDKMCLVAPGCLGETLGSRKVKGEKVLPVYKKW